MAHSNGVFTLRERSIIEVRWCRDGRRMTGIAAELGRNKSSVSREIAGRPRKGNGRYRAELAHAGAQERIARRGNTPKAARNESLRAYIEEKMIERGVVARAGAPAASDRSPG